MGPTSMLARLAACAAGPLPSGKVALAARITTMQLLADKDGSGFAIAAEQADDIFSQQILPLCPRMPGYVNCQRLVDQRLGVFKILSLWESEEDCLASGKDVAYYGDGLIKLRACARFGSTKTEHFEAWKLYPADEDTITTPFAKVSVIQLNDEIPDALDDADETLRQVSLSLKQEPGFCGLIRLLGSEDAKGTYMFVSYWESGGALLASVQNNDPQTSAFQSETISFLGSFRDAETGTSATGFRKCMKAGTDISTELYDMLSFRRPRQQIPLLEAGSTVAATFQLACISFGVGVFVIPSVMDSLSIGLGAIVLVCCAIFSNIGMQLMIRTAEVTGASTYEDVLRHAFGDIGRTAALISLAMSTLTANCTHLQFISQMWVTLGGAQGGIMHTLVGPDDDVQQFVAKLIFGCMALPLCFKRNLSELRFVSIGVVIFCAIASTAVCAKSLQVIMDEGPKGVGFFVPSASTLLSQTPNVAFGFSSVVELFHVRAELKRPADMSFCAHLATVIVCTVYMAVGVIGGMAFKDPGANVLQNFKGSYLVSNLQMGLIVMITLLYPIINFPCISALDALRGRFTTPSAGRWRLLSVAALACVLFIDTIVPNLNDVFGLAGSLGLGLVAYVLPSSAALAVALRGPLAGKGTLLFTASVVLVFGLIMTFGSTAQIIYGIVTGPKTTTTFF